MKKEKITNPYDPTDRGLVPLDGVVDVEISSISLRRIRKLKKDLSEVLGFEPTVVQVIDYMIQIHENVFESMHKKKRRGRK